MMNIRNLISEVQDFLNTTFTDVDKWFEKESAMREFKPVNGGWNINEVLEHIALTNHFLLILIEKGTKKALQNQANLNLEEELNSFTFQKDKLTEVGLHQSFNWFRPEHMEPKGEKTLPEIRDQLKSQLSQCLDCLSKLPNGEGILYKTTMSVNDLGKINVYEYIYFLGQHGQRHLTQMKKVEAEFLQKL
jgi:DinB superfamily